MKEFTLKSKLGREEIERLILADGYERGTDSFSSQMQFVLSGRRICLISNHEDFIFACRHRRKSGWLYPIVNLRVIQGDNENSVVLQLSMSNYARVMNAWLFAGILVFHAFKFLTHPILVNGAVNWKSLQSGAIISIVFVIIMWVTGRQARSDVYSFIRRLISDNPGAPSEKQ